MTDDDGRVDTVMRVNYAIDPRDSRAISDLTIGQFKDWLLASSPAELAGIGTALTGVMAAAVAKICDVHELIAIARKIRHPTRARTTLGLPGTLSSRLQPNHPTDDPRGITLLVYWGLALGAGDALIGLNPAIDTVESVSATLALLDRLRRHDRGADADLRFEPRQDAARLPGTGAPVEIMFQSLAGTESALTKEFDVTVDLLDHAYRTMADRRSARRPRPEQFMYFETGQGSEFTYGKHHGIDMTTTEALCYGLARRYDPFMVNNVTGFIGPETHADSFEMIVANLQDHFMGKLLGLPMGMAPCYTLHSAITLDGQQIATQLLTAAGANYYMDVVPEHRPHAGLLRHQRSRQSDAARSPWPAASPGVSRLGHRARHLSPPGRWRRGTRTRVGQCAAILRFRRRAGRRWSTPRPRLTDSKPPARGRPTRSAGKCCCISPSAARRPSRSWTWIACSRSGRSP